MRKIRSVAILYICNRNNMQFGTNFHHMILFNMYKKTVSVFLVFLVMGSTFVTLCPSAENNRVQIHLIADPCESHDCHRSAPGSQKCDQETCDHSMCRDEAITGFSLPVQTEQIFPNLTANPVGLDHNIRPEVCPKGMFPRTVAPAVFPVLATVLRI